MTSEDDAITRLLAASEAGDVTAWDQLVKLVYPELKRLARLSMSGRESRTLNTTALVHECYLRLAESDRTPRDKSHLMALSVRVMRQVLVDHARERLAQKRGSGATPVPLTQQAILDEREFVQLVEVDDALRRLGTLEPRQAKVFECRYFGGLSEQETAETVGVSTRTVHRDWDAAREWLAVNLGVG